MNRLQVTGIDRGDDCELVLLVDGADVLAPLDAIGVDPDVGLPLLGIDDCPRRITVGRCGCGDDRCGEVSLVASVDGDTVVWDQWESTLGYDVPSTFRFPLASYVDVVATADAGRPWESAERRYARQVEDLIDDGVRGALSWRGLRFVAVVPAADGLVAVHLRASYRDMTWSVYVVVGVTDDPSVVPRLLRRHGPTAWGDVYWWGENTAAALQQPPMAGKRWRMWRPPEV